ncbi:hypothetical protein [Aureispira anguillae]|uniref:Uncharacterized protein n=1 Tax=Aureispira anguillae TaxID=2864201 RepID=A0A915YDH0_9BACT|nr:hypothetical protein [Aureispira anguillae]BDS11084.1 hypothetical protein AsAng_0017950 [Aureispira anguillae]
MKENEDWILDDSRSGSEITPKIIADLKVTSGWLRYLGIMGFVLAGLGIIITFITLFNLFSANGTGYRYSGVYFGTLFMSLLFMSFAIYMSVLIFQYGSSLKSFINTGKNYSLEEAFEKQKVYWTVAGIATTVIIGFYFILVLLAALGG